MTAEEVRALVEQLAQEHLAPKVTLERKPDADGYEVRVGVPGMWGALIVREDGNSADDAHALIEAMKYDLERMG